MPVIGSVDLASKRIFLASGVREYHPVADLYVELRELRRTDETLRGFDMPLVASGNIPKGGGKATPRLTTFRLGWRVVPEDVTHVLNVTGEQITDDGQSGPACFDLSPLSAASKVIIQYEPPAAEIIVVETGGGGGGDGADWSAQERAQILAALDAPVSSRATQAQILSDATPFQGARIDAAVSSRAEPGDAMTLEAGAITATEAPALAQLDAAISTRAQPGDDMALTSNERDDLSLRIWDEPLSAHVSAIGSAGHEMGHIHDANIVKHGSVLAGSTAREIQTTILGSAGIYNGLTVMIRGATERCARVVKYFDGETGVFIVAIPFAFVPQAGDSIFVLSQRHTSMFGALR